MTAEAEFRGRVALVTGADSDERHRPEALRWAAEKRAAVGTGHLLEGK